MAKVFLDSNFYLAITKENCGEQIRALRERSGVSREDLARLLGVNRTTLLRMEQQNGSKPSDDFINRLKAVQLIGVAKLSEADPAERYFVAHIMCAQRGRGKSLNGAELFERLT